MPVRIRIPSPDSALRETQITQWSQLRDAQAVHAYHEPNLQIALEMPSSVDTPKSVVIFNSGR